MNIILEFIDNLNKAYNPVHLELIVPPLLECISVIPIKVKEIIEVSIPIINTISTVPLNIIDHVCDTGSGISTIEPETKLEPKTTSSDIKPTFTIYCGNNVLDEISSYGLWWLLSDFCSIPKLDLLDIQDTLNCTVLDKIMAPTKTYGDGDTNSINKTNTNDKTSSVNDEPSSSLNNKRKHDDFNFDNTVGHNPRPIEKVKRRKKRTTTNVNLMYIDTRYNINSTSGLLLMDRLDPAGVALRFLYPLHVPINIYYHGVHWTCINIFTSELAWKMPVTIPYISAWNCGYHNYIDGSFDYHGIKTGMWVPKPSYEVMCLNDYDVKSSNLPLMYSMFRTRIFVLGAP